MASHFCCDFWGTDYITWGADYVTTALTCYVIVIQYGYP